MLNERRHVCERQVQAHGHGHCLCSETVSGGTAVPCCRDFLVIHSGGENRRRHRHRGARFRRRAHGAICGERGECKGECAESCLCYCEFLFWGLGWWECGVEADAVCWLRAPRGKRCRPQPRTPQLVQRHANTPVFRSGALKHVPGLRHRVEVRRWWLRWRACVPCWLCAVVLFGEVRGPKGCECRDWEGAGFKVRRLRIRRWQLAGRHTKGSPLRHIQVLHRNSVVGGTVSVLLRDAIYGSPLEQLALDIPSMEREHAGWLRSVLYGRQGCQLADPDVRAAPDLRHVGVQVEAGVEPHAEEPGCHGLAHLCVS
eukprot:PhM_4_TR16781/c0_g2_i1/m.103529